jgi:type IV pilus assembly protein PilY1
MIDSIKLNRDTIRCALTSAVVVVATTGLSFSVLAAPGELADQPLSLVTSTKPNILLLLDDSGSMDQQNVITTAAQDAHNDDIDGEGSSENRSSIETDKSLLRLCAGYNTLAFNPTIKYEKWRDYTGNVFDDQQSDNISGTVLENPLDATGNVDLSDHIYLRWDDDDDDGVYDLFSIDTDDADNNGVIEFDGECGPHFKAYDSQSVVAIPASGEELSVSETGVLTDSNSNSGNYSASDNGIFRIDIPDDGVDDDDFITFEVTFFNVDISSSDTDSLTVYGGLDSGNPIANAITVTELFDASGNAKTPSDPYTVPTGSSANVVSDSLKLNDDSASNRNNEIKKFTVKGNQATLVFDGGSNIYTRIGFSLTWEHTDFTGVVGDGLVTKEDCTNGVHHCVRVDELPDTEAEAVAQNKPPYNTKENYANWYTYYRKKDYVAKKALGDVVFDSSYRLGFATINDNGDGGVIVQDMTNNTDNSITANKSNLLEKIYRTRTATNKAQSDEGTPLIKGLSNAGRYFLEGVSPESTFLGTTLAEVAISSEHTENNTVSNNSPVLNDSNGGQCQQNFTLVFSDGAWNDDVSDYVGTGHDVNGVVSGFVGDVDSISAGDKDNTGDGDGDLSGGIYADDLEDTLADVAMYYFLNDLAPSATDSLSLNLHGDTISHQHMVTFAIGFGVNGDLTRNPNVGAIPEDVDLWPTSVSSSNNRIDDLRHAAFNSRGDYLSAGNVEELQQSLDDIITEIAVRLDNTASGASFSAFELLANDFRYDITYNNVIWWGDIEAVAFNQTTKLFEEIPSWSADNKMRLRGENRHIASHLNGRKIITYNGTKGIPFAFPSDYQKAIAGTEADSLDVLQLEDLLESAPHINEFGEPDNSDSGNVDRNQAYGEVIVDYLRGSNKYDGLSLDGQTVSLKAGADVAFDGSVDNSALYLFRNREEHYIGALIHSQPRFVGAPNSNYPDDIEPNHPYSDFAANDVHKNRRNMVYVGGNDGMLHGFYAKNENELNEDGGEEVFAYIPRLVSDPAYGGKGLSRLALEGFDGAPYVDGSPVVGDVYVNRSNVGDSDYEAAQWRSYLVGGLRAGARGIYVLDVTNPDSDSSTIHHPQLSDAESVASHIVVNEFTHPDMGHIFGKPSIARMNNGRWAAIVGNGYNSSVTGSATASLFVVYLDAPTEVADGKDTDNDGIRNDGFGDYTIIQASSNSWLHCANENQECVLPEASRVRYSLADGTYGTEDRTGTFVCDVATFSDLGGDKVCEYSDNNGLSQPRVIDVDGDGTVDRIYAGDLHGNMWIFDVSQNGTDTGDGYTTGAVSWDLHVANQPLYTACSTGLINGVCPRDNRQPITSTPLITNNPLQIDSSTDPNHLVFFGTGQYLTDVDEANASKQSFYAIWDAGTDSSSLDKSNLTPRTIENETAVVSVNGQDVIVETGNRTIVSATVNYSQNTTPPLYGWYYEFLPDAKERVVLNPLLFGDVLLFQTLIPTQGTCNATAGSGYIMAVDALTGGNPSIALFGETDANNIAGTKVNSVIVGSSITKTEDGTKINVTTADGQVTTRSLSTGIGDINDADAGDLYRYKGRKSWSILH